MARTGKRLTLQACCSNLHICLSGTRKRLTDTQAAAFFLSPEEPLHRQYEALRAFFVDQERSADVARRFALFPRVLPRPLPPVPPRPRKAVRLLPPAPARPALGPARDRVRDRAVALRKRNLSVYDIQRELAQAGQAISINALAVLLREEGFARLPRRRDEERPPTLKPEAAEVADVRRLDLSPRSFRTALAGLFLFVPLLDGIDLGRVVQAGRLPGSQMIPAEQAVRACSRSNCWGRNARATSWTWSSTRRSPCSPGSTWCPSGPTWRPTVRGWTTAPICA